MKIKITVLGVPAFKQKFMDADFHYFQADVQMQFMEAIQNMKNDKRLSIKLLNLARKASGTMDMSMDALLGTFEALSSVEIIRYKLTHRENESSVAEIDINDLYFQMYDLFPVWVRRAMGFTKEKLIRKLDKEMKKVYSKDIMIEELSGYSG